MILFNQIPNKSLFKIREVCEICGIKPYVLRFWDTEFEQIESITNSEGKKLYRKKDILIISILKDLLFERKLTIEKARHELDQVNFDDVVRNSKKDNGVDISTRDNNLEVKDPIVENCNTSVETSNLEVVASISQAKDKLNFVLQKIDILKKSYHWI